MKGRDIIDKIESSSDILGYRLPELGFSIWPFVRHKFLCLYNDKVNSLSEIEVNQKKIHLLESLLVSAFTNPYSLEGKEVLFFNSAITNIRQEDGKYFNRVTDYFFFQVENKAALIEGLYQNKIVRPRVHKQVYSFLPMQLHIKLLSFASKKAYAGQLDSEVSKLVGYLTTHVPRSIDDAVFWENCFNTFRTRVDNVQTEFTEYRKFLSKKKPKLIFLEDASYGEKLPLLLAAKEQNIPVAELQHGLVNESHLAYNYGQGVLSQQQYRQYLPDYYLAYSDFWSETINLPSEKIAIGNPHLEAYSKKYSRQERQKVLLLGTGTAKDQLMAFCGYLKQNKSLAAYELVLRPHPWERAIAAEKYAALLDERFTLDLTENLFESLADSAIVFGEMSTALYEASVYNVPIFLIGTEHCLTYYTESTPFPLVSIDPAIIHQDFPAQKSYPGNTFWAENWQSNFQNFIAKFVGP